jgi:class 3 adenylate cyclase
MNEKPQRRLAAIVSADVVGYSKLMHADEAGTHRRLKAILAHCVTDFADELGLTVPVITFRRSVVMAAWRA